MAVSRDKVEAGPAGFDEPPGNLVRRSLGRSLDDLDRVQLFLRVDGVAEDPVFVRA